MSWRARERHKERERERESLMGDKELKKERRGSCNRMPQKSASSLWHEIHKNYVSQLLPSPKHKTDYGTPNHQEYETFKNCHSLLEISEVVAFYIQEV